ncbi:MAG: glycosyltransferase family 2 protein [Chitinophagales bacterium]
MGACTILILTYKGRQHLELLLPTVQRAIEHYRGDAGIHVLIVDNGSDENTRQFVLQQFPDYTYRFSTVNDYLFSLNAFVKELRDEWVIMLNDDMKVHENLLNELIPLMQHDKNLFAVSCRIMDFDGSYTASAVRTAKYSKGWVYTQWLDASEENLKYTLYPGGGSAIFRSSYFNELNGFDPLYRPAYAEDMDLGTRAWQKKWKTIYNPQAILYHREGGTINDQYKKDKLEQTMYKNHILYMIKNTRQRGFLFWFFLMLPYRLLYNLFKSKNHCRALLQAIRESPIALQKRKKSEILLRDETWFRLLDRPYAVDHPIPV